MPSAFSHAATSSPSLSHARFQYPPPGQITTATRALFPASGRNTEIVGRVTFVIHFASFVGASAAARTRSGPIGP